MHFEDPGGSFKYHPGWSRPFRCSQPVRRRKRRHGGRAAGPGQALGIAGAIEGVGNNNPTHIMLHWTLVFLVIALIAAFLGFGALAGAAATVAKVCFVLFLILWIVSLLTRRPA